MNNEINIGELLRKRRKQLKMTQEQLAERSGLSVNFISRMERLSSQNVSLDNLIALSNALEISVSGLLNLNSDQEKDNIP